MEDWNPFYLCDTHVYVLKLHWMTLKTARVPGVAPLFFLQYCYLQIHKPMVLRKGRVKASILLLVADKRSSSSLSLSQWCWTHSATSKGENNTINHFFCVHPMIYYRLWSVLFPPFCCLFSLYAYQIYGMLKHLWPRWFHVYHKRYIKCIKEWLLRHSSSQIVVNKPNKPLF